MSITCRRQATLKNTNDHEMSMSIISLYLEYFLKQLTFLQYQRMKSNVHISEFEKELTRMFQQQIDGLFYGQVYLRSDQY